MGGIADDAYGMAGAALGLAVHADGLAATETILWGAQPAGITRPVRSGGKMVAGFATGVWSAATGITNGHTGFDADGARSGVVSRTGQKEMLKWTPPDNSAYETTINTPASNLLQTALAGKLGLWVYVDTQPGYDSGAATGTLTLTATTNAGGTFTNSLAVGYNSNQVREGWNFLKFVMRDPSAYRSGTGVTEYHPFGVAATGYGTGADSDILNNAITKLRIGIQNMSGATLYFDSIWTGFDSQAQIVLGADQGGSDLITYGAPLISSKGWKAYVAIPMRVYTSGSIYVSDIDVSWTNVLTLCQSYGWEAINHTVNHRAMASITSPSELAYEVEYAKGAYIARGLRDGLLFYASPQSSSSRLSERVIKDCGFLLQRHARKWNVSITPWGVDNPQHIGAIDMGSVSSGGVSSVTSGVAGSVAGFQTYTKIKRAIDVIEAYGDTFFPFFHNITTLGDSGSGEDLTGDNLFITYSAFQKTIDYMATREAAGGLRVRDAITGFYYGIGR